MPVSYTHLYEVNAYRYMLKPIEYNIFKNNMGKCIENIIKKKNDFLTINDKSKLIKIKFDDILYIETSKRQLIIHTINGHETVSYTHLDVYKRQIFYITVM